MNTQKNTAGATVAISSARGEKSTRRYFTAPDGKIAGYFVGNVARRKITSQQVLRNGPTGGPAIAYHEAVLAQIVAAGAVWLEVENTETGVTYRTTVEHFLTAGAEFFHPVFGPQRAIPLAWWAQTKRGAGLQLELLGVRR